MAEFLAKEGQLLLPMIDLIEQAECAIDEVIDVMGRATVEAVLRMSAEQLAGPRQQGKRGEERELYYHGTQPGPSGLERASASRGQAPAAEETLPAGRSR